MRSLISRGCRALWAGKLLDTPAPPNVQVVSHHGHEAKLRDRALAVASVQVALQQAARQSRSLYSCDSIGTVRGLIGTVSPAVLVPARRADSAPRFLLHREHALRDVVAPQVGGAEIGEGHLGALVPGLAHEVGQGGAGVGRRGGEASTERVPAVARDFAPKILSYGLLARRDVMLDLS